MASSEIRKKFEQALAWRKRFAFYPAETLRLFYGPGEFPKKNPSKIEVELKNVAIDVFKNYAWVTAWDKISEPVKKEVIEFLKSLGLQGAVLMDRSKVATDEESKLLFGSIPETKFSVCEHGIPYLIQLKNTKHPGLFLDHAPLRHWLLHASQNKTVLNLFAYTGSLSVAAGRGGANHVTTLDLSRSTIDWAKENWIHAGLPESKSQFIYGDALEWLPRLAKKNKSYDLILCDPPSFSRSKNGTFSTAKDSKKLHEQIFSVLKPGGILISSINSENYSENKFLKDIHDASVSTGCALQILKSIDLPETFPTSSEKISERYLKGFFILKI